MNKLKFVFVFLLALSACRVNLVADPDKELKEGIIALSKNVDRFYINLLENLAIDSIQKVSYEANSRFYLETEVELDYYLLRSKMKPLNEHSVKIVEISLKLWTEYKEEHRKDWKKFVAGGKQGKPLEKGDLIIKKLDIHRVFEAMLVAETAKEMASRQTITQKP